MRHDIIQHTIRSVSSYFSRSKTKKNSHIVGACVAFIWSFNTLFFALPIAWEPGHLYYRYDPDVLTCSFMWKYTWHFMTAKFLYPILSGTVIVCTSWQVRYTINTPGAIYSINLALKPNGR